MTSLYTVISSMLVGLFRFVSLTENQDARAKKKSFHNHPVLIIYKRIILACQAKLYIIKI